MARFGSKGWRSYHPNAQGSAVSVSTDDERVPLRILGLDPGSRRTGYGLIEIFADKWSCLAQGRIEVEALPVAERLARIHAGVSELLDRYAPKEAAIERVFVNRNVDSALKLGQARGAALAALGGRLTVSEYAPRAIKLATVGYGAADKSQVAHMMRRLLNIEGKLAADAADALAVAICHVQHRKLARLTAGSKL